MSIITVTARYVIALLFALAVLRLSFASTNLGPNSVTRIASPSITNLFALSPRLYSGASPETESAFAELKQRGVTTIISVDGAAPNADLARKFGIRYVHLPVGYDGTSSSNAWRILKAASESKGAVFVHCHHGKHRGPMAAGLIARGAEGWSALTANAWMEMAGTSHDYPKLYEQVASFAPPTGKELRAFECDLPERSVTSGFVEAMVELDKRLGHLWEIQKSGNSAPANHPDLNPTNEATLLAELYSELIRSPETHKRGEEVMQQLKEAEKEAWAFQGVVKSKTGPAFDQSAADNLLRNVAKTCASCHKRFRN